jgi:ATP-dependent exoDNAse (exonuclease V) alpha subunit
MNYPDNPQLQMAYNFLELTNQNVFLTGKAGTGKTTFLQNLKRNSPKRMVVLAPTGVAAINAGGATIHSFFQMPFGPHIPELTLVQDEKNGDRAIFKLNKMKIDIIRTLDLLIIDEISMVRADLLDGIDEVLRRYRNTTRPFGGVQLLMIGDLQQLAPVVKDDEWNILKAYYETAFFFSSRALRKTSYITVELKHIYRQSDRFFIDILNQIRNNRVSQETFIELNKRYIPGFTPNEKDGYITLTTHNYQSNELNQFRLGQIAEKAFVPKATVEGNFPVHAYPTELELELKKGAQVMFVKNDPSPEKLYYNGKIGKITHIEDEIVYVNCPGDTDEIPVGRAEWQNTSYTIDNETKEIKETIEGTFVQYPLKLAWAITIHKSQGLTFEKVVIDAAQAFSHGQVYVALSRCKHLMALF